MPNSVSADIEYFFHEGRENMEDCLRISFEAAVRRDVKTLVIFTGIGAGPKLAIEKYLIQPAYADIKIVAVTMPYGTRFSGDTAAGPTEISEEDRELLRQKNVPLVRAHLPFNAIAAHNHNHGVLGQDLSLIANALSIFGGSMSLCVQAALMACDAGEVELGEHVIALTSDTAILVRSSPTERLLIDFIVREILCKPMSLTIIKNEARITNNSSQLTLEGTFDAVALESPDPDLGTEE
jgi:hypothetical protein